MTAQEIIRKRKQLWSGDIEADREYTQAVAQAILESPDLRREIQRNPELLIEMAFVIVDKGKRTVPFFLNDVQQSFIDDLNQAIADYLAGTRIALKFLILKGRQQGFTSVITAYQLACSITKKNFAGFTLADDADNTSTIFEDKARFPYSQLPEALKPTEKYNNRKEFHFEKLNSKWRVATAGGKGVGRSKTLNFFHGSEAGFWDDLNAVLGGVKPAITADSIQILESTANGFNDFKDLWDDDNNWENKFYAWWETKEYRQHFESSTKEQQFKASVKSGSQWIYERCRWLLLEGLDWEQLYWYYQQWVDMKELVKQEYPCTADEAFLSSGATVFDVEKVIQRKEQLKDASPAVGYIRYQTDRAGDPIPGTEYFEPDDNGSLIIYEMPQKGVPYVIGGDTAEGGTDYCVGQVLDNTTGAQTAKWRGHTDTDLFAKEMFTLGNWYNTALISIEVNFDLHPVKELERLRYGRLYYREVIDDSTRRKERKHGWRTTTASRPPLIARLVSIVRDSPELITDLDTLNEMLTFVRDDSGKPQAVSGKHDDCILALAIAHAARDQQTYFSTGDTAINAGSGGRLAPRKFEDDEADEEDYFDLPNFYG